MSTHSKAIHTCWDIHEILVHRTIHTSDSFRTFFLYLSTFSLAPHVVTSATGQPFATAELTKSQTHKHSRYNMHITKLIFCLVLLSISLRAEATCPPFNPTFQICCNGVLHTKGNNSLCCGTNPYNPIFKICCNGVLSTKGNNSRCCGTIPYNPTFKICCNGVLRPRSHSGCGH